VVHPCTDGPMEESQEMNTRARQRTLAVALAAAGVGVALLLAIIGLHYGAGNPEAFAHAYTHPASGNTIHLHIDADITNGTRPCDPIDTTATVAVGMVHKVGVCLEDYQPNSIEAFELFINNDDSLNFAPDPQGDEEPLNGGSGPACTAGCLDDNPDGNDGDDPSGFKLGGGWDCSGLGAAPPRGQTLPIHIVCSGSIGNPDKDLSANPGLLATVQFTALAPGTDSISFSPDTAVGYPLPGDELARCGTPPRVEQSMGCFGATITKVPDQGIVKTVLTDPVVAGSPVDFKLDTSDNTGGPTNAVVFDDIKNTLIYNDAATDAANGGNYCDPVTKPPVPVAVPGGDSGTSPEVVCGDWPAIWSAGTLQVTAPGTLHIIADVPLSEAGKGEFNAALLLPSDPNLANNAAVVQFTVGGGAGPSITLSPISDTNTIGEQHTVTATVSPELSGVLVTFTVTGANPGASGVCAPADCRTNASGQVTFTYTGFKPGDDTITASAPDRDPAHATKTWGFPGVGFIFPAAGGKVGDGLAPVNAALAAPARLVRDGSGRIYVADSEHHRVRRIDPGADGIVNGGLDEVIATVAGTGIQGYTGNGGPAVDAKLSLPQGVALDSAGNLYIADTGNHVIRKVDTSGKITTIAGTGVAGHTSDGPGTATTMKLDEPRGLAFDGAGNLLIADTCNHRIRRLDGPSLTPMRTIAGGGPAGCGAGDFIDNQQPATSARLNRPTDVAVGTGGVYFIADSCNQRVRKVDATDTMTTVAGSGAVGCGSGGFGGDSGPATSALLNQPSGIAVGGSDLYIADTNNCRLRRVSGGTISTAAGTGTCGYGGDGGLATSALVNGLSGVTVDTAGNVHIADTQNHRLRFIDVTNSFISTVAGTGAPKFCGDGGVAVASSCVNAPEGLAVNAAGDLYIADAQNHRVRYVKVTDGHIYTVAGKGEAGFCGDDEAATSACLNAPADVAVASDGTLYISDRLNNRIRAVSPGGDSVVNGGPGETITTFAGDGTTAVLNGPRGLALDDAGDLYIADTDNCRVGKTSGGPISTVAGTGTCGYDGEGTATGHQLNHPRDVVMGAGGDFYIADTDSCRVRLVSGDTISTVAGTGACGFAGDFDLATAAQLNAPAGLTLGSMGELVVSDQGNHRLRTVLAGSDGIVNGGDDEYILTSAGGATPTPGFCGDPDPNKHLATDACLNTPSGLARAGNQLYLSDQGNDRVRKVPADCDLDGLLDSEETGLPGDTEACIADTDGDGHKDPQSTNQAGANLDPNEDNCPLVANPGQGNNDSHIGNGKGIAGDDLTAPNSDVLGDLCDPDADNDDILNGTDPDPSGDITYDDNNSGTMCPTDAADDGPSWDSNCDGKLDGWVGACGSTSADADTDGLKDAWENCKWGTYASDPDGPGGIDPQDSDGDTLGDCKEAADVDGNSVVNFPGDVIAYAKAILLSTATFGQDGDFDIDGNNVLNFPGDVIQEAKFGLLTGLCK